MKVRLSDTAIRPSSFLALSSDLLRNSMRPPNSPPVISFSGNSIGVPAVAMLTRQTPAIRARRRSHQFRRSATHHQLLTTTDEDTEIALRIGHRLNTNQLVQNFGNHLVALITQIVGGLAIAGFRHHDALIDVCNLLGKTVDHLDRVSDAAFNLGAHFGQAGIHVLELTDQAFRGCQHGLPAFDQGRIGSHLLHTGEEALQGSMPKPCRPPACCRSGSMFVHGVEIADPGLCAIDLARSGSGRAMRAGRSPH